MSRISIDDASADVKEFLCSLPLTAEGAELELNGRVICKVIPARQYSEEEKQALFARGRELVRRAQRRNRGVPARVLEREVREAVDEVRRRKQTSE